MGKILCLITLIMVSGCSAAAAGRGNLVTETSQSVAAPFGFADYCDQGTRPTAAEQRFSKAFCHPEVTAGVVQLTPERGRELADVQQSVNAAITYHVTTTWDPNALQGDCKTYSARKELELLSRGWPAGAMRIATAFVDDGGRQEFAYHAVLLIATDHGTLALDSRRPRPAHLEELHYIWMTEQSRGNGTGWVRLAADPAAVKAAMAANAFGGKLAAGKLAAGTRNYAGLKNNMN
jgi:predicted transglutaminase-like cysteine proteinase